MTRRSKRGVISNKNEILEKLGKGRDAAIDVMGQAKIGSREDEAAQAVRSRIDELADALTGEHKRLVPRAHST